MTWLDDQPAESLRHLLRNTNVPFLSTLLDGTILWANPAFESLLGYTLAELTDPMIGNWRRLTYDPVDTAHDAAMAAEVVAGVRKAYVYVKPYRHKQGHPVPSMIHVLRVPHAGEFLYFHVSVTPLQSSGAHAAVSLQEIDDKLTEVLARIPRLQLQPLIAWANQYPIRAGVIVFCILAWVLGDEFVTIARTAREILMP
ncbi:hypothetical protein V7x_28700 [Crateriforma conspicua]|uniref:PAS domain-containing protein n=1 Tax=Crateriforma conspicua TaxID=2527996 RepID=A0A5C6FY33_9PLAN|nr:PAS domain S-box protein [Crateriforma conspicua]TWU67296.1 hypothetical protein V7x_28700 [Crateriforma conspicua]